MYKTLSDPLQIKTHQQKQQSIMIRMVKEVIFYDVFVGSHVNCIKMAKRSSVCVPQSDAGDCQKGLIKASLVV